MEVFATVPDPRGPRGVRHRLATILTIAAGAVLAGARSWVAVTEWAADADRDALSEFGIGSDAVLPCESTIRRTLAAVDGDDLDARVGAWMATRVIDISDEYQWRMIAIDGKSLRGGDPGTGMPHLVAGFDPTHGVVLAQQRAPDGSGEIPALRRLLETIDLDGVVVTADALHCQRETATTVIDRGGHYLLTVKGNQPGLLRHLTKLPWKTIPGHTTTERGHGRTITGTVKAVEIPAWVDWPDAAQVLQIRRTRTVKGRKAIEVAYAISSVPMTKAGPAVLGAWIQGHRAIENQVHWVRDVTYDEDRHQLRVGAGPQVMATLRNTAISLLHLTGATNIAAALRHHARDTTRPIHLLATA